MWFIKFRRAQFSQFQVYPQKQQKFSSVKLKHYTIIDTGVYLQTLKAVTIDAEWFVLKNVKCEIACSFNWQSTIIMAVISCQQRVTKN